MPTARVIEAVNVLEDGCLSLATRFPRPAPDQLSLDRLEEGFDGGIVIAVALAAHRGQQPMLAQDLLIVMRTVLAATVAMEDAAPRR